MTVSSDKRTRVKRTLAESLTSAESRERLMEADRVKAVQTKKMPSQLKKRKTCSDVMLKSAPDVISAPMKDVKKKKTPVRKTLSSPEAVVKPTSLQTESTHESQLS